MRGTLTLSANTWAIPPGKTTIVELALDPAGRALLGADHGRLSATLKVLWSSPASSQTQSKSVRVVREKDAKGKKI